MSRLAEFAIKGFLYQFNKSLLAILEASDDAVITVEGIVEDIEVRTANITTAIQCKYHESASAFTLSSIYEPILQMMSHFVEFHMDGLRYVIFAHYPDQKDNSRFEVTMKMLQDMLETQNKELKKYVDALRHSIDIDRFLLCFTVEFGPTLDEITARVCSCLEREGMQRTDVETLIYPNAVHLISQKSIQHLEVNRKISKTQLLDELRTLKKTAINHWTLSLKSRKAILDARRRQLKYHLDKNSRLRYFIISEKTLEDFDASVVSFISDYVSKYHFKPSHISTPLFCLDCSLEKMKDIQYRLHKKGIVSTDGYVGGRFDEAYFFREPMTRKHVLKSLEREFTLRITTWTAHHEVMNNKNADDLFVLGECNLDDVDCTDMNLEALSSRSFAEVKYLLGVSNAYE